MTSSMHTGFKDRFFQDIMPKIYGFGAAIVILGAMFKLLNWPGGGFMLGLGLSTEAIIFILSSFEPKKHEPEWEKVYPELAEDYHHEKESSNTQSLASISIGEKLDVLFEKAKVDVALMERLSTGIHHFSTSIEKLAALSEASYATDQYIQNIEKASLSFQNMHNICNTMTSSMNEMTNFNENIKNYNEQIQESVHKLTSLNVLYATTLTEQHSLSETTNSMKKKSIILMEKVQEASIESENFKDSLQSLNTKLTSLNNIYGNMLTAFKN